MSERVWSELADDDGEFRRANYDEIWLEKEKLWQKVTVCESEAADRVDI